MAKRMSLLEWIAYWLIVIGSISWGVLGVSRFFGNNFELVQRLLVYSWLSNIVYILVGISGIIGVVTGIKLLTK